MKDRPKFSRIILADDSILVFFLMTLMGIGFIIYMYLTIEEMTIFHQMQVILILTYSLSMFSLFISKIKFFYNLIINGIEVEGIIDEVKSYKDKVGINFTYEYKGKVYKWGNTAKKSKKTMAMATGMKVTLLMYRKKVVIKDLLK